jgi:23S rRNA maturation-related 3'-5' exoribonuclease YhaM
MDIATLSTVKEGSKIDIRAMITDKKTLLKTNKESYLSLDIQDATGKINFPIWDNIATLDSALEVGTLVDIADAILGSWNGAIQLKNPRFHVLTEEELETVDINQFIPSYNIPPELIDYMEQTITNMDEPYKTIATCATGALGYNTQRWKAFTECVAAEKHHGNKRGGLFLHTYGVLINSESVINAYVTKPFFCDAKEVINPSRLRLKAILHDIKKVDEYEYQTNIRRKPGRPLGHIYDGVSYLSEINKEAGYVLSKEEENDIAWSILTHHGQYGPANPETLEEWILHLSDMIDSRVVGSVEK